MAVVAKSMGVMAGRVILFGLDCGHSCSNSKALYNWSRPIDFWIHSNCFYASDLRRNHASRCENSNEKGLFHSKSEFCGSQLGVKQEMNPVLGRRNIWTSPVAMGRRSSKIATRKTAQDAKKMKLYGKIGKQIVSALKRGGPSPESNSELALILAQARMYDVPKDIIERNMKKALEKGQAEFTELTYEVYGLGGVGIVLEVLTDNNTRTAQFVRDIVKKGGGKMADPGSVMFNFRRQGVIAVQCEAEKLDDLLVAAMDAGADDLIEPSSSPDSEDEEEEEKSMAKVICSTETFSEVRSNLENLNYSLMKDYTGLQLVPLSYIQVDEEARELNQTLMDKLMELDDVDAVYSNQK